MSLPKSLIIGLVITFVLGAGIWAWRKSLSTKSQNENQTSKTATDIIEKLPDIRLLKTIIPLQGQTEGIEFRVTQPSLEEQAFTVEVWEYLSGTLTLFQRYHYVVPTRELLIDLPLFPGKSDIFTQSILDSGTGEVVAVIDEGKKEECARGTQLVLNFCAARKSLQARQVLDVLYQRILADTTLSNETKDALIKEQQIWLQESERVCNQVSKNGGSLAPLEFATCQRSSTRARIDTLLNSYPKIRRN